MRKIVVGLCVFLGLFAGFSVRAAEVVKKFDAEATLTSDRMLTIVETIKYDFGDTERHGIYRDIPEVYERNGAKYRLHLSFDSAIMDGAAVPSEVQSIGDDMRIKIGDANTTITGAHTYVITYKTSRAINDFSDYRELYWNVTGNGWTVPIEKAGFLIHGPAKATQAACYTGVYGSVQTNCTILDQDKNEGFVATRALEPSEGLTIVLAYPLASIRALSFGEKAWQMIVDNWNILLPLLALIVMFGLWWKNGREPEGRGTVVPEYEEPDKLAPAVMDGLMEQKATNRGMSATILDLARRGYLKIKFVGDPAPSGWLAKLKQPKISFVKQKPADAALAEFENAIYRALFKSGKDEVSTDDLVAARAWTEFATARNEMSKALQDKKLFNRDPRLVRALWGTIAGGIVVQGFVFAGAFGPLYIAVSVVTAAIVLGFGWQMPQMTKDGAIMKERCEGFKWFLSVTEKQRLDFTDAPERRPEQFERFLPAAVAFGVEAKWAKQFESIQIPTPSYMDMPAGSWNSLVIANAISSVNTASASAYSPPSSAGSGGSGFSGGGSGGGFGGGGGGSW